MKHRILFVDDDAMVLAALQRMLRPMRSEWEMEFLDSGAKALQRMREQPFDVILSDMRMPGMNGVELLQQVMANHPRTVRLILSGQAEPDLILKCVGVTHQYLSKPCDADTLKATIARVTCSRLQEAHEPVRTLVARMHQFPSMPAVYLELTELLAREDATAEQIGLVMSRDPAMTATILKLVNSAFFGLRRAVTCTDEAAAYLGIDLLKALTLAVNVFSQFDSAPVPGVSVDGLWVHSMAVAVTARRIAQWEGVPMSVANESFTAGVLHDAGQLILVSSFPKEYAQVPRLIQSNGLSEREAERLVFGASHVEVGGYLFGLWGLPEPVVTAIALHDRPGLSPERRFGPLTTVHVANALVREASAIPAVVTPPPVDEAYLREIGLLDRLPAWRAELTTPSTPFSSDACEHPDPPCR